MKVRPAKKSDFEQIHYLTAYCYGFNPEASKERGFQRFELLRVAVAKFLNIDIFTTSLCSAFAVSLIPAIFMGMLFPLGLRIYSNDVNDIGIKTGKVFFSNTLGSVIGSLFAGFVLIPFFGMWNTTLILVNLSLVIALYLFLKNGKFTKIHLSLLLILTNRLIIPQSFNLD